MVDVCRWFLDHQDGVTKTRNRPHLNVVIDYGQLLDAEGRLANGGFLDEATIQRLLCDAGIHRCLTEGASAILDYGRATRTVTDAQWNALVVRDRGCRHPGCDRKPGWCEAHHVIRWSDGGTTDLVNLVLKCSRHHHLGHLPGWSEKLKPDATLEITMPDGRVLTSHPPGLPFLTIR